jgi:2-dehydropantoate 2-reductase
VAELPHVAIFGAGSVGCFIGGAWHAAGLPVSFIGRESVRADVAEHGIILTQSGTSPIHLPSDRVDFATKPKSLARADVIALCVKSYDTAAAAKEIGRNGRRGATVISFQNGVSNVELLKSMLPKFEVVPGMVPFNVAYQGRGRWHKGVAGDLVAKTTPVTERLAEQIGDRTGRLRLIENMDGVAWGKLLINLNNAVNALSGKTLLEQLGDRDYRRVLAASMIETLAILSEAGITPAKLGPIAPQLLPHAVAAPNFLFRNTLLKAQRIDANARSSMADDLAAGRRTEIDYLNGEVVKLAKSLRMRAPVNSAIVDLVKAAEAGVERLWSAKELREYVLQGHRGAAGFGY